ncbi:MAG: glutaminyl-tRNA synthase (glutamine-hydrolyzing) subunit A [Candidatus Taylorbacteria bacterium RIFCSPHIGHO2_12_FULL_45_16]|uniref:Glutamyl-tRNA(Gln) amidotransferase subunit A n=1 Tax=Candidatus Taylorbacteria bacterium RIFCSPHIGHO2_12_FULL_45_16 TaxID=1802315 RepID=A0A1G2MXZ6_9BACT|nr:MAG: glutaminyl-tRNA synthase (glutamine-hydrolyzing) subunit A [Candidatus Taylorbacteria bacterium RIFCSPHIGHO2_12_FULL_45_16]
MKIDLSSMTITKAHEAMKNGDFTAVDLAQAYLDEAKKRNPEINAYLEIYDDVIEQAKVADEKIAEVKKSSYAKASKDKQRSKDFPMLLGIPFAIKDNILIKGRIASSASKILENYRATYDATVIEKLKKEGVVFIGRTNMDEFAMGGSTENSAYGVTKNPHHTSRVAGGSSGGSAAALAMDGALAALGSDTGGSIRQPASFNGLVGLKPTYGRVSRSGVMSMGSSLDQIGPFGKTVTDAEIVYNAIKGQDALDGTTISDATYSPKRVGQQKPVIGIPRHFLTGDGIAKDVLANLDESLEHFYQLGYEIKEIKLPNISHALPAYYVIMPAEVSSNLSRFDGVKYGLHKDGVDGIDDYFETRGRGFGKEARRRILLGTYVLSSGYYEAYYNRANAVRRIITQDFLKAFEDVDVIITPTTPAPAFKIGEKTADPVVMYLEDIFTVTANLTGLPAMSVPSGFSEIEGKKLPLGLQMIARHGDEKTLFEVGKEFQGEMIN